jgi:hypothetical protein
MPILAAVLAVATIPKAFAQEPEPAPNDQASSGVVAKSLSELGPCFPFEMTGTNHFFVEVKLNGEGPYRLIFDLGAPVTLLSVKAARESESLSKKRTRGAMGAEGLVKEMQFGESTARDIPVVVFDHPAITTMSQVLGKRFDGILGYTFFARYRTTIDYQKKRLWFEPVRESTDNVISALPEKLLNPAAKSPTRVVVPRATAIGVRIESGGENLAEAIPPVSKVVEVREGSPAAKAGLKPGDVIVALGSHWIFAPADLAEALSSVASGADVKAIVIRDGKTVEMRIRPERVL